MKNSFVLHHDTLSVINELTDEQSGKLIKEILQHSLYLNNPKEAKKPSGLSGLLNAVFHPFEMQLNRDFEKYKAVALKNAENGKKGGRPKQIKNPTKPKKADNDKDSDNDKDKYMLENEFQDLWNGYTLKFLKKQNRKGGSKSKAKSKYLLIRNDFEKEEIFSMVRSHASQKIGHKDLERLLSSDFMKQFIEDEKPANNEIKKLKILNV